MKKKKLTFQQGYVCAAAWLASAHGETSMAEEMLKSYGKIRWRDIDEYDRTALKRAGIILGKFGAEAPR